ncbi:class I SAM-dependent methyltransferase [Candidatus Woesearchaeota archaeon]|nr:class I SAM-dependent methyltransferase [Candidatus Woesearchaeota archaeon]
MVKDGSVHRIWYDSPEIWSKEQGSRTRKECTFLHKVFQKYKVKTVLDVGCGAGNHCAALSQKGYKTQGIDANKELIKFANKSYPKIPFRVGDQRKYRATHKFDAVITLCTVLSYATTNEELFKTLKNHYKSLKKKGILIIDTFNPIIFIDKVEYLRERTQKQNEFGYVTQRKYSVDENQQLSIDEATFINTKGNVASKDISVKRMTFPQEMRFFLEQAGFNVLEFYGDFSLRHKKLDGHRMIVVAQK